MSAHTVWCVFEEGYFITCPVEDYNFPKMCDKFFNLHEKKLYISFIGSDTIYFYVDGEEFSDKELGSMTGFIDAWMSLSEK